ncbi:ethylmalonyl-CoA decarboxylase-like protein [Dinothrombium tinctorium]|uniref:Ethylmalonyl-CoA decarboxylase n=1 Tax=Dinothrombium tinctorium TaxID=1965070 RepID=A0A443RNG8_9ACAR|nr:ethylmalonyl-CoA decarboxylase-like protein [Dinothrombium tinctorium]
MENNVSHSSEEAAIASICENFRTHQSGCFVLDKDDASGVATLTICNPTRKNAISGSMMVQLRDTITQLEQWQQGKAVIIYGAEGSFCSGGDMNTVRQITTTEGGRQMSILMQYNLKRLQNLHLLTVALIQGKAIGGGAELTTACDFRLMTKRAQLGFVHVRMGITPGWGGGSRLVKLLGPSLALDLLTSGKQLNGDEAKRIGLVNDVLDCDENDIDDVLLKCKQWLQQYVKGAPETIRAIKAIVVSAMDNTLPDALKKELEIFLTVWGGPMHRNALSQNLKHR